MSTLKSKTVSAIKWSYFSLFVSTALQLVFAAVLARLLTPEVFSVVALAFFLQRMGQFVGDLGVGQALVQKPELTEEDVHAGFTSALVFAAAATVLLWMLAPLAGEYFRSPELVAVFRGYVAAYLPNAVSVVCVGLLRRALRFRPLAAAELSSYILGHGVMGLGAAYLGYGAFSLAISAIAQALIQMIIVLAAVRRSHSIRLTFRPEAYRYLYSFGGRVTVVNFFGFLSSSLDTLMLGRLYSPTSLGLYNRAYNTVVVPSMNFANTLNRVLAPSFSAVQSEPERLRRGYHSALGALLIVMSCLAGCIVVDAREIVRVMLGPNFASAVGMVQIFGLAIPFLVCNNLSGVLAEATARLNAKIAIEAAYLGTLLLAFWTVYRLGGGVELVAAVLLAALVLRNLAFSLLAHAIVGGGRSMVRAYGVGLVCGVVSAGVSYAVVQPLRNLGTPLAALFIVQLLLGALLVAAAVLLGPPNELQAMARRVLPALTRWRSALGSR